MSKLPAITAEKLIKILEKDGFTFIRQKGSHRFYEKIIDGDKIMLIGRPIFKAPKIVPFIPLLSPFPL